MTDQPTYNAPPPQYEQPRGGAGLAITALILGILAILFFWTVLGGVLFGVLALIFGLIASGRAKRGQARGRGMAITGAVLGALGLLGAIVLVVIGASFLSDHKEDFSNLQACLDAAGDDQAKVQQCQRDFQDDVQN